MRWKFSQVQMESEQRVLLEVYGNSEASLKRCTLSGSEVMGEVNRCTDAILIRTASKQDSEKAGPKTLESIRALSEYASADRNQKGPEVTCTSTLLRHSEHAIRMLVPAATAACTSSRAKAELTNCIVENNKKAFVMSYASQVARMSSPFQTTSCYNGR